MADVPVTEVLAVDAALDALDDPTSSEVYDVLQPFSNDAAIAVAAKRALAGGGGGSVPNLAAVLTEGNDGEGNGASNFGDLALGDGEFNTEGGDVLTEGGRVMLDNSSGIEFDTDHLKVRGNAPTLFDSGIDAGEYVVANVADPEDDQDAATKKYVDDAITPPSLDWTTITKLVDQAVINSAVVDNDDDLHFALAPNAKYRVRGSVFFDTTAAGDFKFYIAPGSPTLSRIFVEGLPPSDTALVAQGASDAPAFGGYVTAAGTTGGYLKFEAIIHNGAGADSFQFSFAQNTATADTGAIVRAGSYLEYAVVA